MRRIDELKKLLCEDGLAHNQGFHLLKRHVRSIQARDQAQGREPVRWCPLAGDKPGPRKEIPLEQAESQIATAIVFFRRLNFFRQERDGKLLEATDLGSKHFLVAAKIQLDDRGQVQKPIISGKIDEIVQCDAEPGSDQSLQGCDECIGCLGAFQQFQHNPIGRQSVAIAAQDEARREIDKGALRSDDVVEPDLYKSVQQDLAGGVVGAADRCLALSVLAKKEFVSDDFEISVKNRLARDKSSTRGFLPCLPGAGCHRDHRTRGLKSSQQIGCSRAAGPEKPHVRAQV